MAKRAKDYFTDYYCSYCSVNFNTESIWDSYEIKGEPVCKKCFELFSKGNK